MNKFTKIAIVIALVAAVVIVYAIKHNNSSPQPIAITQNVVLNQTTNDPPQDQNVSNEQPTNTKALPKLIDLGAGKCIPCKMMAPILEELKKEYKGRLEVIFIDVWKNPREAEKYEINLIPTQIFYDASGKEVYRHEGFFAKEDIQKKLSEMGIK